jgi:KaiC/GvpD/RAD55 family RecA-like ATPase
MGFGRKNILLIGMPFVGKSAMMEYLMHEAANKADVVVIHDAEMSEQNVAKMIEQAEMKFQDPPKPKPISLELKRYDVEPLPEPIAFLKSQPKPWVPPPGKGKKYHDKHQFRKRL